MRKKLQKLERERQPERIKVEGAAGKKNPSGKAQAWLGNIGSDLDKSIQSLRTIKVASSRGMPVALSTAWTTTITDHDTTLKTFAAKLRHFVHSSVITDGEEAVKSFKRDIGAGITELRVHQVRCKLAASSGE